MKIPINLASQPFVRTRALIVGSVALSLVLLATLGLLVSLALADRAQMADVRNDISRLQASVRTANAEQVKLDAVLRRPENAEVLERSMFLNTLLRRKGISWTQIFADLEKVLPYNVRIIQIRPSVDVTNKMTLDMLLGADQPTQVIELLKALEGVPFGNPEVLSQQSPTQAEPLYRFRVSVDYAQKL